MGVTKREAKLIKSKEREQEEKGKMGDIVLRDKGKREKAEEMAESKREEDKGTVL